MTIIFFLVGLPFTIVGLFFILDHKKFMAKARKVNGKVVALEKYQSENSQNETSTYYRPIIDFSVSGDSYRLTASIGTGDMKYKIDQRITLLYAPNNPKDAKIDTPMHYVFGGIFVVLGLASCSVFAFEVIRNGFSWLEPIIVMLIIMPILLSLKKAMKSENITSLHEFKRQFKVHNESKGSAVIVGSKDDPFLDPDRVFYKTKAKFREETAKLEFIGFIINIIFFAAGCVMLYFGWDFYQSEKLSPKPDIIQQYAILGMGGLFVFAVFMNLLKSVTKTRRI